MVLDFCKAQTNRDGFSTDMIKDLTQFNGRKFGEMGHKEAQNYLIGNISKIPNAEAPYWAPGFVHHLPQNSGENIVFFIRGNRNFLEGVPIPGSSNRNPIVIIFAHYDHLGEGYPGGNDNASGVYALMNMAKKVGTMSLAVKPRYPILFVLADKEEQLMEGSREIHRMFPYNNIIINIDTIGGFPDGEVIPIANNGNYDWIVSKNAHKLNMNIRLIGIKPGRSDITHFLRHNTCLEFGYPTNSGKYHSTDDTYENLYLNNLKKVSELATETVMDLLF